MSSAPQAGATVTVHTPNGPYTGIYNGTGAGVTIGNSGGATTVYPKGW
jgi:hypothetical protein